MFRFILKKAIPLPKIESFNKFLFIGPHPDDIEIGAGATATKLAKMGKQIKYVIVTDGGVGAMDDKITEDELKKTRKQESINAANKIGVTDIEFLEFHDGNLYDIKDIEKAISKIIVEYKPDCVFTPDPNVPTEMHPDHLNVGRATTNAVMFTAYKIAMERIGINDTHNISALSLYYTDKPNSYVKVKKYLKLRMEAVRCHKSQFDDNGFKMLNTYFNLRYTRFGFRKFQQKSEGFKVLGPTHWHCFPEASEF